MGRVSGNGYEEGWLRRPLSHGRCPPLVAANEGAHHLPSTL